MVLPNGKTYLQRMIRQFPAMVSHCARRMTQSRQQIPSSSMTTGDFFLRKMASGFATFLMESTNGLDS
jgi:hypothetical protein